MEVKKLIIIPQKIVPEEYVCEVCGRTSKDKSEIIKCESKGIPIPLVKEGDIIHFKDCIDTPLYYEYIENRTPQIGTRNNYGNYMDYLYKENYQLYKHISTSYLVGSELMEWVVARIEIYGHKIKYYLVTKSGGNFSYSHDSYFEPEWMYPVIESNDMMLKILNLYNKR